MKKTVLIIIAALALVPLTANAQYNETNNLFYHSFRTPQINQLNAAFYPTNNTFYLQTGGLDVRFGSPISLGDVIHYDASQQQTIVDLNNILNALDENNNLRFGADIQLIGFGFKINHTFVTFNTKLYNSFNFGLPTQAVNALLKGNVDDNGNSISEITLLDGELFNLQSYLEAAIGVGHHFEPLNLTVGLRAKLLYGVMNIQTDNTRVTLNTANDYDQVSASLYYQVQEAAFAGWDTASNKPIIDINELFDFGHANTGLAFDIGAKYDMGPFTFSLAINDLSAGIHWQHNVNTIQPEGGQGAIVFDGVDVSTMLDGGQLNADSLIDEYTSGLSGMTPHLAMDSGDYWYSIPTKINIGASYNFLKILRAGVLFHGQFDRGLLSKKNITELDLSGNVTNTFRFNTTLSLGVNVFNWVELIVGSSAVYDGHKIDVFNPGVGLVLTPGTFVQTYIMADYISSIYLTDAKAFNLKFGINWLFGKGGRSSISAN